VPRAVSWDIARARESVEVYCAFLNPQPVRRWLREFAAPLAAGVRVTVYTRPHEPGTAPAALVHELISAGCSVETRERMHEKVMIVDDTILWHGSLTLLANMGPTDLMMRFTDPTACARVQRIMSAARMERPVPTWNGAAVPVPGSLGVQPGDVVDGRLYLNVSFAEKDTAKRLVAARWDNKRKLWHVAAETPREQVARWLPAPDKRCQRTNCAAQRSTRVCE
jgi:phosphatidylserine/phosphatidylglycerophosphate/cardiolipin synthase-like enzyme